ncbi:Dynein heavy chain 12 axonemal, partial [Dissostichus eleginoides]
VRLPYWEFWEVVSAPAGPDIMNTLASVQPSFSMHLSLYRLILFQHSVRLLQA